MRAWFTLGLLSATLLLGGCRDSPKEAPDHSVSTTAESTRARMETRAVDEGAGKDCDAYVAALERCIKQMPPQARGPMQKQLDRQRAALKAATPAEKQSMDSGCRDGLAALKQNPACKP